MKDVKDRRAKFVTTMVLRFPDGKIVVGNGEVEGEILFEKRGQNGFGYDPLFYSYELKKTFAEASDKEKNSVSHRSRALEEIVKQL